MSPGVPLDMPGSSNEFAAEQVRNGRLERALLPQGITELFAEHLADMHSKHVPKGIDTPHVLRLKQLASRVGYRYCDLGHYQRLDPEQDGIYVASMARTRDMRPVKLVLTRCGRVWCDNTHWGLAAMVRWGTDVRVDQIPFYLIDLRSSTPVIVGRPLGLMGRGLALAVSNARSIQRRLDKGWRPIDVRFTMGDLFDLGRYDRARALVRSLRTAEADACAVEPTWSTGSLPAGVL
jgi:hypothetical protein